jgi:hypothetical protein
VAQRLVRERSLAQLSHAACTLALFLVTVADAQGLSDDVDTALCQRVSLTSTALLQARPALILRGFVASHRPLYQVFALDAAPHEATPRVAPVAPDDEPVDIKAVVARLWAGLG